MRNKPLLKLSLIAFLALLLLIPLTMIESTVSERAAYRGGARASISESWTGEQHVIGPLLIMPYRTFTQKREWNHDAKQYETQEILFDRRDLVLPERLEIDARVDTQLRQRGIYEVPVYTAKLAMKGQFSRAEIHALVDARQDVKDTGQPYLAVMVSDTRGFSVRPVARFGEESRTFAPGTTPEKRGGPQSLVVQPGLHLPVAIALDGEAGQALPFAIDFDLRGMEALTFAPLGQDTRVGLTSPWPHPSFTGRFLPESYEISDAGFSATWRSSSFADNARAKVETCLTERCNDLIGHVFGVRLAQPTDVYLMTLRAVKYGVLFVVLTFAAAFLFEVTRRRPIHPVQYALVGLALAIFYLLLLALSEHLPFAAAYLVSAAAVTLVLGIYGAAVAGSPTNGGLLAGIVAGLYGVLYVILSAEDTALLMGSLLLFGVLTTVMLATRKVDWYSLETGIRRTVVPQGEGR